MAHIPMGDIQELWNQTSQHSWSGLRKTLEEHKGKAQGISNNLVLQMLEFTKQNEKSGKSFPDSAQKLYDEFNSQLQHATS